MLDEDLKGGALATFAGRPETPHRGGAFLMSAIGRKRTLDCGYFWQIDQESQADLPQPPSYAPRMDDDREAYEFSHALYLARQVDGEAAQMIVEAAESGVIQINEATDLLMQLSRPTSKRHLFG